MITGLFGFSREKSELGVEGGVGFFAAEFTLFIGEGEIFEEKNVADGQSGWEVFDVFGKEEDSEFLVVEGTVDDFESHAIISFYIFAIWVGRVSDDTESGEEFVGTGFGLDFFYGIDDELVGHSD